MKTLVLGGGIAGLSSAIAQQERGDEVEVLEAREGVGLETSFANGGLMAAELCETWNQPGVSKHLIPALFGGKNSMLRIHPKALPSLAFWGLNFLRHSTLDHFLNSCASNYRLARYSLDKTLQTIRENNFNIDQANDGIMALYRDQQSFDYAAQMHSTMEEFGLGYKLLDTAGAVAQEPHLSHISENLTGGIFYAAGGRGDCYKYCQQLAELFKSRGGVIRTGVRVDRINTNKGAATGVLTNEGEVRADRVIVALGNQAPKVLRTAGVGLGVKPAKGYTITVPVDAELPRAVLLDVELHIGVISLGNSIRIGGGAEFAGVDTVFHDRYEERSYANVEKTLPHLMPHIRREEQQSWAGLRPVTADGIPYIGKSSVDGLFVNGGLGHLGWTQGMGAAYLLADLIGGTTPEIDPQPYRLQR